MAESMSTSGPMLTQRELNRATLDRQLLLGRVKRPVAETVEDLAGLQAQDPHGAYVNLWSRLEGFDPARRGRGRGGGHRAPRAARRRGLERAVRLDAQGLPS